MRNKIPFLAFLFFAVLLVFLLIYSYKKLLIFHYQKKLQTAEATQEEVHEAIVEMTAVGNPAVPAFAQLLAVEQDPFRIELMLGALLRIQSDYAEDVVTAYFQDHPAQRFLAIYDNSEVAFAEKMQDWTTRDLQFLAFSSPVLSDTSFSMQGVSGNRLQDMLLLAMRSGLQLDDVPVVEGDALRFQLAVVNLSGNKKEAVQEFCFLLASDDAWLRWQAWQALLGISKENQGGYSPELPKASAIQSWKDWASGQ